MDLWDAKNNLNMSDAIDPSSPFFVDLSQARGDNVIKRIYRDLNVDSHGIVRTTANNNYLLLTGHIGSGKSTELRGMCQYLNDSQRYFVVYIDCVKDLDINNLKYSDVLMAAAAALTQKLSDANLVIDDFFLKSLERWSFERTETQTALTDLNSELKTGIEGKTGLPLIANIFATFTSKISTGSSYRDELRRTIRDQFTKFAEHFNHLIEEAKRVIISNNLGKGLLFIIDGTDRLRGEDAENFFIRDVHQLRLIESIFIYAAPIYLLHTSDASLRFQKHRLPMLKIRDKNDQPIRENYTVLRNLIWKRVPSQFFDNSNTLDYLIGMSGGHPRDLIRLINIAITYSDDDIITLQAAEGAVKQAALDYRRDLTTSDYELLVKIDKNPDSPETCTSERTTQLLEKLVILEYNAYYWKTHPLVQSLQGYLTAAVV